MGIRKKARERLLSSSLHRSKSFLHTTSRYLSVTRAEHVSRIYDTSMKRDEMQSDKSLICTAISLLPTLNKAFRDKYLLSLVRLRVVAKCSPLVMSRAKLKQRRPSFRWRLCFECQSTEAVMFLPARCLTTNIARYYVDSR